MKLGSEKNRCKLSVTRFSRVSSLALCVVIFSLLSVSASKAETLMGALKSAYENNPSLMAERARQRASDEAVPQALAGFRPTVSLSGNVRGEKVKTTPPGTTSERDESTFGVSISQPVFSGFRTINSTRQARAAVSAGQADLYEREQSVLLSVVSAYMDVRRARRILGLRRANVRFLTKEAEVTRARAREGELTRTDTSQTKSRLYQGKARLSEAQSEVTTAEANFEAIVGKRPGRLAAAPAVRHLVPKKLSVAIERGKSDSPIISAAEYRKKAADHEVNVLRGELLPTVTLDGNYQRSFDPSETIRRQDDASVELRFSMPLYNAGTNFSRIREARALASQREYELEDRRREVKSSVQSAWQRRISAHRRMRDTHISVTAAEAALKGIKLEAAVGERSVFEVLDAQRDVIDAQEARVNAEREFIVATFTLLSAMGQLSAEGLELETAHYDPNVNYKRVRFAPGWTPTVKSE